MHVSISGYSILSSCSIDLFFYHTQLIIVVLAVQSLSYARLFAAPWTAAHQASLPFPISQGLLKLTSIDEWCHPTISSSVAPFPPALNLSQHQGLFQWANSALGGQSIGVSVSASVLPVNIQGWFPLGWTGLISLLSKGLSSVFSSTTIQKDQLFSTQLSLWSNSHVCTWPLEKL